MLAKGSFSPQVLALVFKNVSWILSPVQLDTQRFNRYTHVTAHCRLSADWRAPIAAAQELSPLKMLQLKDFHLPLSPERLITVNALVQSMTVSLYPFVVKNCELFRPFYGWCQLSCFKGQKKKKKLGKLLNVNGAFYLILLNYTFIPHYLTVLLHRSLFSGRLLMLQDSFCGVKLSSI